MDGRAQAGGGGCHHQGTRLLPRANSGLLCNRNRKLAEAFRAAKAQLNITEEMRVKHGSVYVQQPPPRSEFPLWEVLLQWALDMAYEIGEQINYAWRQHKH